VRQTVHKNTHLIKSRLTGRLSCPFTSSVISHREIMWNRIAIYIMNEKSIVQWAHESYQSQGLYWAYCVISWLEWVMAFAVWAQIGLVRRWYFNPTALAGRAM
jgi:hypothetical protein